jgi:iron(III) transport system substrate-binding protein
MQAKNKKSFSLQSLLLLVALMMSLSIAQEMTLEELETAAKAEGKVVVYSFTSRIFNIETAFEEKYPEIDLEAFDISSTEQIARIRSEQEAGVRNADVAYLSDAPVVLEELVAPGYLTGYVPAEFAERIPDEFETPLLGHRLSTKVLMYNEAAYPDGSPITNLWQLTTDDWRGKVVMVDPLVRGDYLDLMTNFVIHADEMAAAYEAQFGEALSADVNAGEKFIEDLFANDLILVNNTDAVNSAVGTIDQENPPVGFTSYSDRRDNEDEGWALQLANTVEPSAGIVFPVYLGILKDAPHPAAAQLLIHFMMGDDSENGGPALEPFYVAGDYLTRTDIPPHPDAVALDELNAWRLDAEGTLELRQEVADLILLLQ